MKLPAARPLRRWFNRFNGFALLLCSGLLPTGAPAQFPPASIPATRSVSGQFIISGAPFSRLAHLPSILADTNLVHLEPALLSVSAERIKESLRRKLDIPSAAPWRGRIYLVLHPASSPDEDVTIVSQSSVNGWNYLVQLPDVLSQRRFLRAMTSVLLLEMANRNAVGARSAEVPPWLVEGLAGQTALAVSPNPILAAPSKLVDGLPQVRTVATEQGVDPLAVDRRVLREHGILTFAQLNWPSELQLAGDDGGVYRANAEVLVSDLLDLPNGSACLRAMLANLPRFYNWQTAFQNSFQAYFRQPLDVEKWWALQVIGFVAHDPGPRWTMPVSRDRLDEILNVPVDVWTDSNSLPVRSDISLQNILRNSSLPQRSEILQTRLRDLGLAELRLAPAFAGLAEEYRRTLLDFLGQPAPHPRMLGKHPPAVPKMGDVVTAVKILDALDARRRVLEAGIKPEVLMRTR